MCVSYSIFSFKLSTQQGCYTRWGHDIPQIFDVLRVVGFTLHITIWSTYRVHSDPSLVFFSAFLSSGTMLKFFERARNKECPRMAKLVSRKQKWTTLFEFNTISIWNPVKTDFIPYKTCKRMQTLARRFKYTFDSRSKQPSMRPPFR